MNKSQIDILLEKYWNAETSLAEESILGTYFNSPDIDESHVEYAELFQFYQTAAHENSSSQMSLSSEIIKDYEQKNSFILRLRPLMKYAAAIAFMLYAYSICMNELSSVESETTYAGKYTELSEEKDAEEALAITMEALSFLTTKINKTEETISQNFIPIQKAISVIN